MQRPHFSSLKTTLRHNRPVLLTIAATIAVSAPLAYWQLRALGARKRQQAQATQQCADKTASQATDPVADPQDLLASYWQMPGATMDTSGATPKLAVRYLPSAIVEQDGSVGQDNPAVNLYGVCVQHDGAFSITATLSDIKGNAEFTLYGKPPIVEDEYRAELATLDLRIEGATATVRAYTSPGTRASVTKSVAVTASSQHAVVVTNDHGAVSVTVDQAAPIQLSAPDLFTANSVWLGAAATSPDGSLAITKLRADSLNGSTVTLRDTRSLQLPKPADGLSALAQPKRSGFVVGAAVALAPLVSDAQYRTAAGNFNSFTTENALKFQFVHPLPGNDASAYNFSEADAIVNIATKAGIRVHGHTLVFGEANPAWVQQIAGSTPAQLESVMTNHITTVVGHYKGKVASWDVVNEPLADYDTVPGVLGLRKHVWYNAMGAEYIATALRTAHQADPDAELWINEFGLETDDDRFATILALVTKLKQDGVPLTGIGFQSHLDDGDVSRDGHIDTATFKRHMQALDQLGLKARVSELDVSETSEFPAYGDVLSTCLAQSNCTGVTTWGVTDAYSSGGGVENGRYQTGIGLPWDENMRPTVGLSALQQALGGNTSTTTTTTNTYRRRN